MARPTRAQRDLDPFTRGMIGQVAFGRLTATEAARRMNLHPETVRRLCIDLWQRTPAQARRAYADRLTREAEGLGRRLQIREQMRAAAATHVSPTREI